MAVFNWIEGCFAHGVDSVSDASDEIAEAIAHAVHDQSVRRIGCQFGLLSLAVGHYTCVYLRFSPTAGGPAFVHAVAWDAGARLVPDAVERIFAIRYGDPPELRVRELVQRLAPLSVAQATLPLTNLFVEASDLGPVRAKQSGRAPRRSRPRERSGSAVLPWLVAAAAAFAGFFLGRPPPELMAPVGAPPPSLELERRIARLESDQSTPDVALRIQLQRERQLRERALAEKDREIARLTRRLEEAGGAFAAGRETDDDDEATARFASDPMMRSDAVSKSDPIAAPAASATGPPAAKAIALPEVQRATVTADLLWVRAGPGIEHSKVEALTWGTLVEVEGSALEPWTRIVAPTAGWVASEFLFAESWQEWGSETVPDA